MRRGLRVHLDCDTEAETPRSISGKLRVTPRSTVRPTLDGTTADAPVIHE